MVGSSAEALDRMLDRIQPPAAFSRRDSDGLAATGRSLHDLRGIRYTEGEGGAAPAPVELPGGNPAC